MKTNRPRFYSFALTLPLPTVREENAPACRTPADVAAALADLRDLPQEAFCLLTLDKKNRVIDRHLVTLGLLDSCSIAPREVYRRAILDNAASIIVAHNHPSGDPAPSADDLSITRQLCAAGRTVQIPTLDHVIIGRDPAPFFSIRESGMVDFTA